MPPMIFGKEKIFVQYNNNSGNNNTFCHLRYGQGKEQSEELERLEKVAAYHAAETIPLRLWKL